MWFCGLGSRIGETDWWGKGLTRATPDLQKLIQVDVDEEAIGRTRPVDWGVVGDVKVFLQKLIGALRTARFHLPKKGKGLPLGGGGAAGSGRAGQEAPGYSSPMLRPCGSHMQGSVSR